MDNATADPLVGRTVAQYEVIARLGGGGMGVVYAARDAKLGRRVALKFLPPQWSHDESAKQRFIREAQAASATDHPNICTVHDIATADDGQLFIVMAHYEGETLKQRLESGPVPVDEAIEIAAQLAEGLAKAHAQGVVHRDIKPGNLMLTEDGVRILDFGLAKFADARLKLTLEGSTLGTIAYMSPEQVRGEDADARSDVWATGVVLYEMLAGDVPFKGGYPEAISHAIRNDPPAPLRTGRSDISEALEQIVFRALHKDQNIRFQTARDLARALRRLQGRTLPIDLRTELLPQLESPQLGGARDRWWRTRRGIVAAAIAAIVVGTALWMLSPVERISVAVAPVLNQTGYAELEPYRLTLTQELIAALDESRVLRALPYERLLQIVRRFRATDRDVSSREAMQAIATLSGAPIIALPTLLYENGAWRARVELIDSRTSTPAATYETDGVVSSLMKDTVIGLVSALAARVEQHFTTIGPRRAYLANIVRTALGRERAPAASVSRLRSLDAAAAFAEGVDAYEQQEYSVALRAFTTASERDPTSALSFAWRSRVARLMGATREAGEAGEQAARLPGNLLRRPDRIFIEAVVAESRRDAATAEARYRALAAIRPDDPTWVIELGAFHDRQGRYADAVASYTTALALDAHLARAHLELCRLYGPFRLNDPPNARQQGELALAAYRALESPAGEAQTLWCLADVLNVGDTAAREEAMRNAEAAREIFEKLRYDYNLSRAYNYLALTAGAQGRFSEAASFWERSLASARAVGNAALEPAVLTNLSVTHEGLGNVARAIEYRQQGYKLFEALGDEQRAAQNQANGAFLLIEYGVDPNQGLRDIQNALGVFRKLNDRNFEVFCLRVIATHHRYAGRHAEAAQELNRAISIAAERDLEEEVAEARMDLAKVHFDHADYTAARTLLQQAVPSASGLDSTESTIYLARTETRLGQLEPAQAALTRAATDLEARGATRLAPLLNLAMGELAYEAGRLDLARTHFANASSTWTGGLPHAAAVESRAYLGLLDAIQSRPDQGRIRDSLARARELGRVGLEARCHLYLARIDVSRGRFQEALRTLSEVPAGEGSPTIGRELRAQMHYWRARALAGRGDVVGARAALAEARMLLDQIRAALQDPDRTTFAARPDIKVIG